MAKIIFKRGDETFDINMPEGARVVHAAYKLKLPEIPADCRGQCQCGTCHVHVDPSWLDKIDPMDHGSMELFLLEKSKNYDEKYSRLSCEICITEKLDGLTLNLVDDNIKK
jgi:2Fe-2S ferredoxin